jgi:hypothetical protein
MCIGDVIQGIFGAANAKTQANAVKDSAAMAADAQKYATDKQIEQLNLGYDRATAQMQPMVNDSTTPNNLVRGALGIDPSQAGAYNTAYNGSFYKNEADYNTAKAHNALVSTNAALGKGGAINSGKALRAAGQQGYELAMAGREAHLTGLKGYVDRGDAARTGIANAAMGVGSQAANAFANQGNALSQIALQRGQGLQDAAATGGMAISNALGGISAKIANGGFNWNNTRKAVGNFFGGGPTQTVTSTKGVTPKPGRI